MIIILEYDDIILFGKETSGVPDTHSSNHKRKNNHTYEYKRLGP